MTILPSKPTIENLPSATVVIVKADCPTCRGWGEFNGWTCPDCGGTGYQIEHRPVDQEAK